MINFVSFGEVLIDFISKDYVKGLKNATSFEKFLGGSPSNIAVNIAKQGFKSAVISRLGRDPFGDFILEQLNNYNVDVRGISQDERFHTDIVYVLKSKSSPEFYPLRSASLNLDIAETYFDIVKKANIFHFSSWALSSDKNLKNTLRLLKVAKKNNVLIGFDPNYREILWKTSLEIGDVLRLVMPYVDFIKPSLDDCVHIFKENKNEEEYINIFHEWGVKNVLLTLGEKGFIFSDGKTITHFDSYAKEVIDTTGAGDAFWSGLYIGTIIGMDVIKAARLGNAFSAEKLKYVGAICNIKNYKELLKEYL
ncbi:MULTISPECIES: carbohydrate kinase family protein [Petrotoga]|uniref:Fructokinase n=1 Tax=Petrotoga sibirica TaxID=156202 RepID=A0A4R8F1Q8_9BACT|nr:MULTISPECIES: carbohydrate kinase [Petrotoga]TDX16051.1 fructokinase [Petrotoga sibirica]